MPAYLETAESTAPASPVDVSVCIANWNCRDLLRQCLASLLRQPHGVRLEVIVVDNASRDGAAEMTAAEFPEVKLIRNQENRGFATANSQAAAGAAGRYLFFLNNDTVVPANTLQRLVDFAEASPNLGILGPRLRDGAGAIQASARALPGIAVFLHRTLLFRWTGLFRRAYRSYRRFEQEPTAPQDMGMVLGAAMLIPRRVYDQVGGWNGDFVFGGDDLDLCHRVGRRHRIVYLPAVEIVHFGRVSTRQNLAYTSVATPIGFVRFFRATGWYSEWHIRGYKAVVLADACLQCPVKWLQYRWRRLAGKGPTAEKSLLSARAAWTFLTRGFLPFLNA